MSNLRTMMDKNFHSMPNSFDVIADTATHTGKWSAIQVVSSPTFSATGNMVGGEADKDLTDLDSLLASGQIVLGFFESIKLATGVIIAYKADMV